MNISSHELAYFAGFFDGEGCIALYRKPKVGFVYLVTVSNTNPKIIRRLHEVFGGSVKRHDYSGKVGRENERPCYQWRLWAVGAELFLRMIEPYLLLKRQEAELFLEARAYVPRRGGYMSPGQVERMMTMAAEIKAAKRPASPVFTVNRAAREAAVPEA